MALLVIGVLLFAGIHLIPSLAPGVKAGWQGRLGEGGYKGSFALLLLVALALIVTGWRSTLPEMVYFPPPGLRHPAMGLVALGFILMAAASRKSRLCLIVRHPQLTGVALWGIAHLMMNGNSRDLVLFGGITIWTIVEMFAINRRDGEWVKGEAPSWAYEIVTVVLALVVVAVVAFIHPWIAGMPIA